MVWFVHVMLHMPKKNAVTGAFACEVKSLSAYFLPAWNNSKLHAKEKRTLEFHMGFSWTVPDLNIHQSWIKLYSNDHENSNVKNINNKCLCCKQDHKNHLVSTLLLMIVKLIKCHVEKRSTTPEEGTQQLKVPNECFEYLVSRWVISETITNNGFVPR